MRASLARRPRPATAADMGPERVAADLVSLLDSIERVGADAPAAIAFRMAVTRKGRDLAAACGASALAEALARVRAADPERADIREAVIATAWASLPGWSA